LATVTFSHSLHLPSRLSRTTLSVKRRHQQLLVLPGFTNEIDGNLVGGAGQ
jgi:hypothetical protein